MSQKWISRPCDVVYTSLKSVNSDEIPNDIRGECFESAKSAVNLISGSVGMFAIQAVSNAREESGISKIFFPKLPYAYYALEPHISEKTLQYHHDKHHAKYVATTLSLVKGTNLEFADLVTVMRTAHGNNIPLYNNAAQSWNHGFYWKCMRPYGGGLPKGKLLEAIESTFGSFKDFR